MTGVLPAVAFLSVLGVGVGVGAAAPAAPTRTHQVRSSGTTPASPPRQTEGLQVFLITLGEGELYWEKYGHNALWFRDSTRGVDAAYNWGMFDFRTPGFLRRLLIGDMQYWVEAYAGQDFIEAYRRLDRTVTVQRLNLAPAQAQTAYEYAQWNARDENKFYRYDYFRDNCSTRVRDVIDLALGGALKRAAETVHVGRTYRGETLRLVDDLKLTQFGIDVALGRPSDRPLTRWDNMFVPSRLRDEVRALRVPAASGDTALVAEERTLHESTANHELEDPPTLWILYLVVGLLIASELFAAGWLGRRYPAADKAFRFEVAVWSTVTGLLGAVVLLAWIVTEHVFWYNNENLLLFNPLSLFLIVLAPLSIWRPRWLRPAAICAVIVAMLAALAVVLKGAPSAQDNVPLILLVLPAHFAVAYGLWRRSVDHTVPKTASLSS